MNRTGWTLLCRWQLITGAVIATAAALGAVAGPAVRYIQHDAAQATQTDANTQAIAAISAKLDKVASDTSEIKGSVATLLGSCRATAGKLRLILCAAVTEPRGRGWRGRG